MRVIGGELEIKISDYKSYFTDSGRSSLRLFLRSSNHAEKKYFLPDFFCSVIENIFKEESINYSFYKINKDLTFNIEKILEEDFDVLYIINYFGQQTSINSSLLNDKIVIEDNVFFFNFNNNLNYKNWFAFNSFRKISKLSSGSMIKTNLNLNSELIKASDAPFHHLKNIAKEIKYEYVHNQLYSEQDYLAKFNEAEKHIDSQNDIFMMNSENISLLLDLNINHEQEIQKKRFEELLQFFPHECINRDSRYYSYFVISINNRDKFRKKLMNQNIFLPVHWPQSTVKNELYSSVISIPLFEIYTDLEFSYTIEKLKAEYENI